MKLNKNKKNGGFIISSELVLISTILVIGLVTGLHGLRHEVNEELLDVAQAIGSIDQSFGYTGLDIDETGEAISLGNAATSGSSFDDGSEDVASTVLAPQAESAAGVVGATGDAANVTTIDDNEGPAAVVIP